MFVMEVSLEGLGDFAKHFVDGLPKQRGPGAYIVGLSGDLGAGKTAFVQKVAAALGAPATPTSPTFVLAQTYPVARPPFTKLVHIDAYRLSPEMKDTMGWKEYSAEPENLVLVEWPERIPGGMPPGMRVLSFTVTGETERSIEDSHAEKIIR
jgi:tRNA threonylcarbamoyladenosine biosynthesis protein TsaE